MPGKPTVAQRLHVQSLSCIAVQHCFSFTNSHYSLIQQDQPTAITGWGVTGSTAGEGGGQADDQQSCRFLEGLPTAKETTASFQEDMC